MKYNFRDKFPQRGFCTSWARIWGRILGCEFLSPEFWASNSGVELFGPMFSNKKSPLKNSPSRNSPPKFTSKNSPQNSGWKIHIALLQGHFADIIGAKTLPSQQEKIHAHSFVVEPEYEFNTHTRSERHRFWIRYTYLALVALIDLVTDMNTHTWKVLLVNEFEFKTNT